MERESDPNCRLLQKDYLKLINRLGSREATTRRFFIAFEYEAAGRRGADEESDAVSFLQIAARTAVNYLKQCGNEVIIPENEYEFTTDVLYNLLCRQVSSDTPLPQRVQNVLSQYIEQGKNTDSIPSAEFFAPNTIDFTHGRYICIWGATDFIDRVEYHSASDFPVKLLFLAGEEIYEVIYIAEGKEALIENALLQSDEASGKRLIIVEDMEQIGNLHIADAAAFCTVASTGEIRYYKQE